MNVLKPVIEELEKWQQSELEEHFITDNNIPILDGLSLALKILNKSTDLISRQAVLDKIYEAGDKKLSSDEEKLFNVIIDNIEALRD